MTTNETPRPGSREAVDQWLNTSDEVLNSARVESSEKVLTNLFGEFHPQLGVIPVKVHVVTRATPYAAPAIAEVAAIDVEDQS